MRSSEIKRKTAETDISLSLCLDGSGESSINTGVGFLDHMLTLFAKHGRLDLDVTCKGDIEVDDHHSVEDIGICLGMAFAEALGDSRGIAAMAISHCPWMKLLFWRRWIWAAEAIWSMVWKFLRKKSVLSIQNWWKNSSLLS